MKSLLKPRNVSGRLRYPSPVVTSGVKKPSGWHMRNGLSLASSNAVFIFRIESRMTFGPKLQFAPTMSAPARAMRTAHSPVGTPFLSVSGPTHIVAATGMLSLVATSFAPSIAHSISSTYGKYFKRKIKPIFHSLVCMYCAVHVMAWQENTHFAHNEINVTFCIHEELQLLPEVGDDVIVSLAVLVVARLAEAD